MRCARVVAGAPRAAARGTELTTTQCYSLLLPGGLFLLRLQFPDQYPDKAPRVKFVSEMFHPNIFSDGNLCLDIIQEKWKPIYTVSSILASVQSLLCDPNTESPANADAARLFLADRKAYNKRVRAVGHRCWLKGIQLLTSSTPPK